MYNKQNIFAQIISDKISSTKIYEDDYLIVIKDLQPAAPSHFLALPKGEYRDFADFCQQCSPTEIAHYFQTISLIAKQQGLQDYRVVTNNGAVSGQTIFHFHTHILSGTKFDNLV